MSEPSSSLRSEQHPLIRALANTITTVWQEQLHLSFT